MATWPRSPEFDKAVRLEIGTALKRTRVAKSLSIHDFNGAMRTNLIPVSTIREIESGEFGINTPMMMLKAYADWLRLPFGRLIRRCMIRAYRNQGLNHGIATTH